MTGHQGAAKLTESGSAQYNPHNHSGGRDWPCQCLCTRLGFSPRHKGSQSVSENHEFPFLGFNLNKHTIYSTQKKRSNFSVFTFIPLKPTQIQPTLASTRRGKSIHSVETQTTQPDQLKRTAFRISPLSPEPTITLSYGTRKKKTFPKKSTSSIKRQSLGHVELL